MRMKLALLLVQILLLAFFLPAGVLKIVDHAHMRHEFSRFRLPNAWARWAGAVELLACVLLLACFRPDLLLAVGCMLMVPVMIGGTWITFTRGPDAYAWGKLVLLIMCTGFPAQMGRT